MNEENIKEQELETPDDGQDNKEQQTDTSAGEPGQEGADSSKGAETSEGEETPGQIDSGKTEDSSGEDKLAELTKELETQKDKYLRLMAEYDNFRKRSAKERIELADTVTGNTLSEILPVFDNFERALEAQTTDESFKQGVAMIFTQMGDVLKKLGVEIIDPTGKEFDPNEANAVNQIEDPELGENIVAQTFQKGYKIGGKVIRYAMVVVANP